MPRPRHFPWLIVLLGAGFTVLSAWSFYRAAQGTSAVTDADYYSHGLRYNQTLLEQRAADSLGWQVAVTYAGNDLLVTLSDGGRQPVSGARGTLTLFRVESSRPQQLLLQESAPGRYQALLPAELTGELTAEIAFERAGARLQRRLLLALPLR
jgi:nitrogen fixation protein FixH